MPIDEAYRMSSFFNAYRPSPWNARRLLKLALAGCLALFVWGAISQTFSVDAVPTLLLVGGILWGCSMISGFLRAGKLALVLAASGALVMGTGVFVRVVTADCVSHGHVYPNGTIVLDECG